MRIHEIDRIENMAGWLPSRQDRLVIAWAEINQQELREAVRVDPEIAALAASWQTRLGRAPIGAAATSLDGAPRHRDRLRLSAWRYRQRPFTR